MFQPHINHNIQQNSNVTNKDRELLDNNPLSTYEELHLSDAATPASRFDTPLRQLSDNSMSYKNTELNQSTADSISSADYALNVIFSQFKNLANAKMSHILNMGVVLFKNLNGSGYIAFFSKHFPFTGCRC